MTPFQRFTEDALIVLGLRARPTTAAMFLHAYAGMLRAAMGGAVTGYDRHREAYERTGDPMELERMLRHVKPLP